MSDAAVIVIGTVLSAAPGNSTEEFVTIDDVPMGLPCTIASVRVEESLAGATGIDEVVAVWQEGARGMPIVTSTTYTLLEVGRHYLLLLAPAQLPHTFSPVGGPQGVYRIVENRVLPLEGDERDGGPGLAGQSVDGAAGLIAGALT